MSNKEKYDNSFLSALSIKKDVIKNNLEYNSIPEWDSIGHMSLISELEKNFSISIETDDVIDFSSYEKGKEILKKYKVII
tara:strand:- start:1227 stop:1466 length:240 start_codon:yes stop_codon:yes gene_type:complete